MARRARWLVAAIAVAIAVVVVPRPTAGTGGTLLVLGDSLTWGTNYRAFGDVGTRLRAEGTFPAVVVDGVSGRNVAGVGTTSRSGVESYRRWVAANGTPAAVLVALGTNDLQHSTRPSFHAARIRELLGAIGDVPVVWVDVYRADLRHYPRLSITYNRLLRRVTSDYPNVVSVVDWHSLITANRSWMAYDRLHLQAVGYRARAQVYVEASRMLWERLNPTPTTTVETTIPEG